MNPDDHIYGHPIKPESVERQTIAFLGIPMYGQVSHGHTRIWPSPQLHESRVDKKEKIDVFDFLDLYGFKIFCFAVAFVFICKAIIMCLINVFD